MTQDYQPAASANNNQHTFLRGGGEMGHLTRTYDWTQTPLGPPDTWPLSLRTTLGILLHSAFPMYLFWGDELTCFYNDAYRPSLGTEGKHPAALAKPAWEVWPETWNFIGPLIDQVRTTGEPVWFEDQLVPIYRNGQLDDVYWTFSYSPAYGDDGQIAGVFVTCTETTEKVVNARLQQGKSELLQAVLDGSPAGISVVSSVRNEQGAIIDFDYRLVNRVTEQVNNRTDLVGKWHSALHSDYKQAGLFDDFVQVINTGQAIERERHYTGEGFDNWYETTIVKLDDGVVLSFRDITPMVLARRKVEDSEQYSRRLIDTAPAILWITEPDGHCSYLNKQWYDQTGQTEAEFEGLGWLDATHPADKEEAGRLFAEANDKQIPFDALYRLRQKDGSYRWCVDKGQPRFGPNGEYEGIIGTVVDVHDQKMAEQIVRQSETLFRNVTNSSPTGLWLSDTDGALTYLNKTLVDWTGVPYHTLRGTGWASAIIDEDRPRSADAFLTAVAARAHYDTTFRLKKQDGTIIWCQAAGDPYYHEDGSYAGYAGFCMNVDELVKQQQAQATSEAKFRSLIEEAPIATCLLMGRELRIEVANEAMIDVWGKGPSVIGMTLANALPELRSDPLLLLLDELFVTGQPYHTRASRADQVNGAVSDTYYFDYTFKPLRNADGAVYAIMKMVVDVTAQVMAQERQAEQIRALAESEERFQAAVVAVQGILWTNNAKGEMAGEQPGWSALTGQTYDEYQGFGWSDAVHPDDVQPTIDTWLEAVQARRMFVFEHSVRLRTGDWGLFSVRAIPLLNADGLVREWVGVHTNITEQRRAEEAVRESEERFRTLVEQAPVAIAVFRGDDYVFEIANDAYLPLIGKTKQQVVGKRLFDVLPETKDVLEPIVNELMRTGIPFPASEFEIVINRHGRDETCYFNSVWEPLRESNGGINGFMAVVHEVTAQVLARQKVEQAQVDLLEINQRLSLALDAGNLGSFELGRETGIMICTPQCRANHGQQPEGLATYSGLIDMIVADDRAGVQQAMDHAFDTQTIYHVEYRVLWPDGSLNWIKASGQPVHSPDGRPAKMVGINQNITAQRMAREELERQVAQRTWQLQASVHDLERSNQNLQQFAYIASHDLQEPLRKIQQFGDLLTTQYVDQLGEGVNYLQRMQTAASRMSALIRDLLTFSRISTQQDATAPVSLTDVVQTALNNLDLTIGETSAQVLVETLPTVPGDASQLGQLFQNLLSNALKFRRAGVMPVIRVGVARAAAADLPATAKPTRAVAAYHRIDVSDNGIGFDEKYADRIFQVFQRLHSKSEFAGTGIGLAICEKVAANHGGAITVASQPGEGATFSVYLPV